MEQYIEDLKKDFDQEEEDLNTMISDYETLSDNNVNTFFKLPISYTKNKKLLDQHLISDLELQDKGEVKSLYKYIFKNTNDKQEKSTYKTYENQIIEQWSNLYTVDRPFLQDTQKLIKNINENLDNDTSNNNDLSKLYDSWLNLKNLKYFKEKYQFLSWQILDPFNRNSFFLTFLCYYNMISPVFSLLIPIFMILLPFLILKLRGINITFSAYWDMLKVILANNSMIKFITNFKSSTLQEKAYSLISILIYMIQIYQNIQSCLMFYQNMNNIMNLYSNMQSYISTTRERMEFILNQNLNSYDKFYNELRDKLEQLKIIDKKIKLIIKPKSFFFQVNQIGYIMKIYYELYHDNKNNEALMYSFGFNTYYNHLIEIHKHINSKKLNICTFVSNKKNSSMKNNYYIALINSSPIKNDVSIKKNLMITGPNASGKTTILKSFLINHILSQQIGCGCYDSAEIKCYDYIYSYLNIPDTSGRDSLFQAEARRCKLILDKIQENKNNNHLCIFDELFSGTNPVDAVDTAHGFIDYLSKYDNHVRFLITTHYFSLCKKVNKKYVKQKCMQTNYKNNEIKYTYILKNGTNKTKAGKDVLKQMHYPSEIIK
tara:strand:- start:628 stop:2430 length:1803 start_codon:yes stop_codon:yes gene_type:complete